MAIQKRTPSVPGRQFGRDLRRLRLATGLSADEVSDLIGCSQGKVSRIELAQNGVGKGDLFLMLPIYGITDPAELEKWWQRARDAKQPGWWEKYRGVIGSGLSAYLSFEAEATKVSAWSGTALSGLLQTEAYMRALFESRPRPYRPEQIDQLVAARLARQQRITDGSLHLWVIMDESALHRHVGGRDVFGEQLDHLISMRRHVTLQIVRQTAVWHFGQSGAFAVLSFEEATPVVFLDSVIGELPIDGEQEIGQFEEAFNHLRAVALGPEESRALVSEVRAELRPA